ncbi:hypothetical protein COR50_07320 [Chitinophaga caeni]|uniref:DUF2332 domain-containing protein n=1 Tax=Chitinophaga caeni TaxID=2029983 RepID=A0A291QSR9_9BACT|nr:DUF2332 domain-containing protein [Chitinophaga caeni]ATL47010.1 hypothetical protein COR50_07320 [Chitinophaga caeni]
MKDQEIHKQRFINFAETECKGNSTLYYKLSLQIAKDPELLDIAAAARQGQPIPNIFFAAVHYLLLKTGGAELAKYYPSITQNDIDEIPFDLFKEFCLDKANEIRKLVSSRIVQTNVISRCSYLMPIFSEIIASEGRPTTIIDIGTSAGLTLNFDKYEYWYNGIKVFGDSNVHIKSSTIGSPVPKIYPITQPIRKIGLDQHLVNPSDKDETLWLKALVWPDQLERFTALDQALKLDELKNINFRQAESVMDFEREILNVDKKQALIVYATHVLYQFTHEQMNAFYAMLCRVGEVRDFYFLSVEGIKLLLERYRSNKTVIELTKFKDRHETKTMLAETNGHGNWTTWKDVE